MRPLSLPDERLPWVVVDIEGSGLFPDDGARTACVSVTWPDPSWHEKWLESAESAGEPRLVTRAFPFDQGMRDKYPNVQLDMFDADDPNLPEEAWVELLHWLKGQRLTYHNAKYDMTMLRVGTRHWEGLDLLGALDWDTMIAQREIDPTEAAGLDPTCKRLGIGGKQGLDAVKGWLQQLSKQRRIPWGQVSNRYDLVPWHIVKDYVTTDTEQTALLRIHEENRLRAGEVDPQAAKWIRLEFEKLRVLYLMEWRGVGYDGIKSLEGAKLLEERAAELEAKLPFPATGAGAKSYFIDKMGLAAERYSDRTGKPSIDEEQIRKWEKEGVEYAREYGLATKARRAVSMWYRGYPEKMGTDGRLRTSFKQTHVKTGRMSVERVQLQAMPKKDKRKAVGGSEELPIFEGVPDVRELLMPKEGCGLWSMDLSQAELRVAAKYAHCQKMLDRILSGADVHGETCVDLALAEPGSPDFKYKRDIAKRTNFAAIFQVGGEKLQATLAKQADIHLPLRECEAIVYRWRSTYPEFSQMYYRSMKFAEKNGFVPLLAKTDYQVRSWFGPRDWPNTAWNRVVQGSLAKAFGMLMVETEKGWPGYMVLTIHDSLVMECPLDEGDQVCAEVSAMGAELMTGLFDIEMRLDVERYA